MKTVSVFAPASVANIACGFDVLGLALPQPGDLVQVTLNNSKQVRIVDITGDNGRLPKDTMSNTAGISVEAFLKHKGIEAGADITIHKQMPLGSGLGSSAASTVAAVVAINELLGAPLSRAELLPFAMEGERIACGSAHADNVAPSLLGGIVLIKSYSPLQVVELPVPEALCCAVVHPHVEVQTRDAREILRSDIKIGKAIEQWGNLAGFVAGLYRNDYQLISSGLKDVIIEPVRSVLIPGFAKVKEAALNSGALGCSISGSGPSVFALTEGLEQAQKSAEKMKAAFAEVGIVSDVFVGKVNKEGAKVV